MTTIPAPSVHPTASRGPRVGSLLSPPSRVPLTRLVGLEVRKMVDTLAGRWLVIVTVALALALMIGFAVFGDAGQVTVGTSLGAAAGPFGILLPVLGIMAATAEWSQRAGLVTFSLEPRRGRIVLARVLAGVVVGGAVVLVSVALAFAVAAAGGLLGSAVAYDVGPAELAGFVVIMALSVLQGVAFGFLFLNTPVAIVTIFALPSAVSIAVEFSERVAEVAPWIDLSRAGAPLLEGTLTWTTAGQLATSSLLWIGLPLAIGTWRVLGSEVK